MSTINYTRESLPLLEERRDVFGKLIDSANLMLNFYHQELEGDSDLTVLELHKVIVETEAEMKDFQTKLELVEREVARRSSNSSAVTTSSDTRAFSYRYAIIDQKAREGIEKLGTPTEEIVGNLVRIAAEILKEERLFLGHAEPMKTAALRRVESQVLGGPRAFWTSIFTGAGAAYVRYVLPRDHSGRVHNKIVRFLVNREKARTNKLKKDAERVRRANRGIENGDDNELQYLPCVTQQAEGIGSLVVGGTERVGRVYLWEHNSVLTWFMVDDSFRNQEDFTDAETAMHSACEAWNRISPGGVTFARAESIEDASFLLEFNRGDRGRTLARAFFPSQYSKGETRITITHSGMTEGPRAFLANTLCHELGHVLGFRHSFALIGERMRVQPAQEGFGIERVDIRGGLVGTRDLFSVMSYDIPPMISIHDCISSRSVYEYFTHDSEFLLLDGKLSLINFKVTRVPEFHQQAEQ